MPVIVQTVTSKVSALWGRSYIRDANGKFRLLKLDEVVVRGDMILTEQNAIVQLSEDLQADASPAAPRVAKARVADTTDMDRVIAGLERGDIDFATAAGTSAGDGGLTPATIVERVVETAPAGLTAALVPLAPLAFTAAAVPPSNPAAVTVASPFPAQVATRVLSVNGATETEGTALVFPVQLSAPADEAVVLSFDLVLGSASSADLGLLMLSNGVVLNGDGTITVPAGVSSFVVTVPTVNDNTVEAPEDITLTVGDASATGVINDDDQPTITSVEPATPGAADDAVVEGNSLVYTVNFSQPAATAHLYSFSIGGDSASSADHGAPQFSDGVILNDNGTLSVPAGVSSFTITVPTVDDSGIEASELLPLAVGGVTGIGTILDNDGTTPTLPTVTAIEPGNPGAQDDRTPEGTELVYTVSLSAAGTVPGNYLFSLGGGSAAAEDFGSPVFSNGVQHNGDGSITVPAGVQSFTVTVPTVQDSALEADESVPLTVGGLTAVGTIVDDDRLPTVTGIEPGEPGAAGDRVIEGEVLTFDVTLSGPASTPVNYPFSLGGGSAGLLDRGAPTFSGGVVLNTDGSITVPAGVARFTVTVPTTQDALVEGDETVPIRIGAGLGAVEAMGTIVDDDGGRPSIVNIEPGSPGLEDDSTPEGSDLAFTVTLSAATSAPVNYSFALGGGSASTADHGAPSFSDGVVLNPDGSITVPAGVSGFTVWVPTVQDTEVETDEGLVLTIDGQTATGIIVDDDGQAPPPTVTGIEPGQPGVNDDSVTEGGTLTYTVTLSGPTTAPVSYPFSLGGGTAGAADFGTPTFTNGVTLNQDGTVTVPAGVDSFDVLVPTTPDSTVEGDETVPLTIGGVTAEGTILDDDGAVPPPTVTGIEPGLPGADDDSVTEGGTLTYTVTLSGPTTAPVTYPFTLGSGTAGAADIGTPTFTNGVTLNPDGTITVPAGVDSFEVLVPTTPDTAVEGNESVPLTIGGVTAEGTIVDDDGSAPPPTVTGIEPGQPGPGDDSVIEGSTLTYTVTLSGPTTAPATYPFTLGGGTAGAGDIGTPTFTNGVTLNPDGTITVPAGVDSFDVLVPTTPDSAVEGDETVPLSIGGVTAQGVILDDDGAVPPPTVTGIEPGLPGVDDDSVTEGGTLTYTVTLSGPTTAPVTYPFTLGGGTAGAGDIGTPTFSNGVTLNPDGTITVPAGVDNFDVLVPTTPDSTVEGDETVPLSIGGVSAQGTILDDDGAVPPPTVTGIEPGQPGVDDDSVTEGGTLTYTVTLSGTTTAPVTYPFTLGGGTAGAADIGTPTFTNGVTLNPDGTITVPAGVDSFDVLVPTTPDSAVEGDETVPLSIGGVTAEGTIIDDDGAVPPPTVTGIEPGQPGVADDSVTEGNRLTYTVTLSGTTTAPVTYPFTLGGGTAGAADIGTPAFTNGVTLNPDGTITVPAGVDNFDVLVPTTPDSTVEGDETVPLTIGGVTAEGTILDDDGAVPPPTVTGIEPGLPGADDDSVTEGGTLTYTVTLSGPTTAPATYPFTLGGGTAGAGDIGTPTFTNGVTLNPDGTITVPAGVDSFDVLVPTTPDSAVEGDETVPLSIGGVTAEGTIIDDDGAVPPPTVTGIEPGQPGPSDDSVTEGGTLVYAVTLSGPTTEPVTYPFTLGGGTAGAGDIGTPTFTNGVTLNPDGTITVPAGVDSFDVLVPTTPDSAVEGDETVPLTIGGVTAQGTILDDDGTAPPPTVTGIEPGQPGPDDDSVVEGGTLTYTVTLSGPTTAPVTYPFTLGSGTAGAADIGTPTFTNGVTLNPDGTITVPAGVDNFDVLVPTTPDSAVEGDETVPLTIGGVTAEGTILDDDSAPLPPTVTSIEPGQPGVNDDSVIEGGTLTYTVTLSAASTGPATFGFSLGGGTANAGDFGAPVFSDGVTLQPNGVIVVPPGVSSFTVSVPTTSDTTLENTETVALTVGGVRAIGSIFDDDGGTPVPPRVISVEPGTPGVDDDRTPEGQALVYSVQLSGTPSAPLKLDFALGGGTASGTDIGAPVFTNGVVLNADGSITVPAGVSSFAVTVASVQDSLAEPDETVLLRIGGVLATGVIVDDDFNHTPVVGNGTGSVSEEGLTGGIKDATGSPRDTGDAPTTSGRISITDTDGQTLSAPVLTAPTTALTSGGVAVTWQGSGTNTLTATAGGATVATAHIDADGNYSFTLVKPIDHATALGENVQRLDIGVQASDGQATGTGTLSIHIEDDAPVAADVTSVLNVAAVNTNLMVVLDVSGSMNDPSGVPNQTRLQAAVASLKTVLDRYDDQGDVAVRLVTFSSEGKALGDSWTTVAQAKALLATLQASGSTNYDDALADAIKAFDAPGRIPGGQNVAYFLSDGEPTAGSGSASTLSGALNDGTVTSTTTTNGSGSHCNFFSGSLLNLFNGGYCGTTCNTSTTTREIDKGIQPGEEKIWTDFLTANGVQAHAVGLGANAVTLAALNPIAYNGVTQTNTSATAVAHLADLTAALAPAAPAVATGSLFGAGLGADGGHVHSFSVDGVTFTFNPDGNNGAGVVTTSGSAAVAPVYSFDTSTLTLVVNTGSGGSFSVNLDAGTYRFQAPAGMAVGSQQAFGYALIDNDGDVSQGTGSVNLQAPKPPAEASVLSVTPVASATEGQALEFEIKTSVHSGESTLQLSLASGTATVGTDTAAVLQVNLGQGWVDVVGSHVALPADVSSLRVRVATSDDQLVELAENLVLTVTGSDQSSAQGTGTILDNDRFSNQVSGNEDQCISLKWEHFGSGPAVTAGQSISFTQLPADGKLQVCEGGCWRTVAADEKLSKTSIDSGHLRFVPDANEAGADALSRDGVGNGKNTYAVLNYGVHLGNGQLAAAGMLDVDIKPLADAAPKLTCNLMSAHGGGAPAGHHEYEFVLANGSPVASGTPAGYQGAWHYVCLQSTSLSPDKDGSEKSYYQIKVNQLDVASAPTIVALSDGTMLRPAADGTFWVAEDQADKVWLFRQEGAGPNGKQWSHQSVTATTWNAELDASGALIHKVQGNSITSCSNTPLVLDLDGNGIQTVDSQAGARFDFDGDGVRQTTGWVGGQDGLLVRDVDGDGRITNGRELFGDHVEKADGNRASDGYAALREMDSTQDGVINAADAGFAQLKVWVDSNGDGLTQEGELLSLQQAGVQSLNLQAQRTDQFDNGNHIALTSDYTRTDGSVHAMADVWFGDQRQEAAPASAVDATSPEQAAAAAPANSWDQAVFAWQLGAPQADEPGALTPGINADTSGLDLRDLLGGSADAGADLLQAFLAATPSAASTTGNGGAAAGQPVAAAGEAPATDLHTALTLNAGMGNGDDALLRDLLNRDKSDFGT